MLTDAQLVQLLVDHHAMQQLDDPWFQAAAGRMTVEEAARRMVGREPTELIDRSTQLFRPPSPQEQREQREQLIDRYAIDARESSSRPRRWGYGPMLALAAALLLWWSWDSRETEAPFEANYQVELLRTWDGMRGATGAITNDPQSYRSDGAIALRLRPHQVQTHQINAKVFARGSEGQSMVLRFATRATSDGVIELESDSVRALGLSPGWWTLIVVVGPVGELPLAAAEINAQSSRYEVIERAVRVVDPAVR